MLTSKQRAALRAMANTMDPIFQIGKCGVTDETCKQIDAALEARELIKISVLESSPDSPKDAASAFSEAIGADVVSVVGMKIVLYKESKNKKKIFLD